MEAETLLPVKGRPSSEKAQSKVGPCGTWPWPYGNVQRHQYTSVVNNRLQSVRIRELSKGYRGAGRQGCRPLPGQTARWPVQSPPPQTPSAPLIVGQGWPCLQKATVGVKVIWPRRSGRSCPVARHNKWGQATLAVLVSGHLGCTVWPPRLYWCLALLHATASHITALQNSSQFSVQPVNALHSTVTQCMSVDPGPHPAPLAATEAAFRRRKSGDPLDG